VREVLLVSGVINRIRGRD